MEYYWALHQNFITPMYWIPDQYFTIYVTENNLEEAKIIEVFKAIMPKNLSYLSYQITSFNPQNNILPDVPKSLITFTVADGMSKVGPIWESSNSADEFLKGKVPTGYYAIGSK